LRLNRIKFLFFDDFQLGDGDLYPFAFRTENRELLARLGVLAILHPVKRHHALVKRVAEQAGFANARSYQCRWCPLATRRCRDPFPVENSADMLKLAAG